MMELLKGAVTPRDWLNVGGIVAATVLLGVVFVFLIFNPQRDALQRVTAEDDQVLANLNVARDTKRNIEGLRGEAAKMQELVKQFEARLPENREIPTLLKQFEGFAGEIGLRVELSQLPRVTDERKETIPYSVIARGNFHQIVQFINRLERFQRYFKISDLNIGKEEEGIAKASFTLSTYRFIQPEEGKKS